MIAYIFPPNEPESVTEWIGGELKMFGIGSGVRSHPSNFDSVFEAASTATEIVFYGGTTQLSWLFDTDEKVARWKSLPCPRVAMCNEPVFSGVPASADFPNRFRRASMACTHLLGFQMGDDRSAELAGMASSMLPVMLETALPIAVSKFQNWNWIRHRKFVFIGRLHGVQRTAILSALQTLDLVDVLQTPLDNPMAMVATYNTYAGALNLRSYHDRETVMLPRFFEACLSGCAVLDLQRFSTQEVDDAVKSVRQFRWDQSHLLAASQARSVAHLFTPAFFSRIKQFVQKP